jgi:hypothetical protein
MKQRQKEIDDQKNSQILAEWEEEKEKERRKREREARMP